MTSALMRTALYVLPVLALAACAQADATPRAAQSSAGGQAYQESTGAESTLRTAFAAVGVVFDDNSKSFEGVTLDAFANVEPDACFVDDTGRAGHAAPRAAPPSSLPGIAVPSGPRPQMAPAAASTSATAGTIAFNTGADQSAPERLP